jgi:hypothetical protein
MTAAGEPTRLELEVRFDATPIEGLLYERESDGRVEQRFSGWLGLMSAIEAASEARGGRPCAERGDDS